MKKMLFIIVLMLFRLSGFTQSFDITTVKSDLYKHFSPKVGNKIFIPVDLENKTKRKKFVLDSILVYEYDTINTNNSDADRSVRYVYQKENDVLKERYLVKLFFSRKNGVYSINPLVDIHFLWLKGKTGYRIVFDEENKRLKIVGT